MHCCCLSIYLMPLHRYCLLYALLPLACACCKSHVYTVASYLHTTPVAYTLLRVTCTLLTATYTCAASYSIRRCHYCTLFFSFAALQGYNPHASLCICIHARGPLAIHSSFAHTLTHSCTSICSPVVYAYSSYAYAYAHAYPHALMRILTARILTADAYTYSILTDILTQYTY